MTEDKIKIMWIRRRTRLKLVIQSVKHGEAVFRHRLPPHLAEHWKAGKRRPRLGLWAGVDQAMFEDQSDEKLKGSGAASTQTAEDVTRCWKRSVRQGTLAHEERENEVDVDCRNGPEHIHHAFMTNNDVECMFARVKRNSCSRKLDDLLFDYDHS